MTSSAASTGRVQGNVSRTVVEFLRSRGVIRVYGLVGGHIQPLWDAFAAQGVEIVDVRHECAAVYMAHAESLLTGRLGVAIVTAGPGLTNAMTGIANAHAARASVLVIAGRTPCPQAGMGAMQDIPQLPIVSPLCRRAESVASVRHVLPSLEGAIRASLGFDNAPGPSYLEFPTDLLRANARNEAYEEWLRPATTSMLHPDAASVSEAVTVLRTARRLLVVSGHKVRECPDLLAQFLDITGAIYLDTTESRGAILLHPAFVPAVRSRAMREADVVLTLGRRLDFQLAYGSPAVFAADARFIRIGRTTDEISDNRRGVELGADIRAALSELLSKDVASRSDRAWRNELIEENRVRTESLANRLNNTPVEKDGRMHPYSLISAINDSIDDQTVTVVDGGDILSFARVALKVTRFYLDPGPLGCIGIGVPFANSAAINLGRRVVALVGDGAFGFLGIEIDTAVRKKAKVVIVVANNEGWNIDRQDQLHHYRYTVGVQLPNCRYDEVAKGLGAYAERVEDPALLRGALQRAFDNAPALLDVLISSEPLSPDFVNGLAEVCDYHALSKWDAAERAFIDGEEADRSS